MGNGATFSISAGQSAFWYSDGIVLIFHVEEIF